MVEIKLNYLGELRVEAAHQPSGIKLMTDAPVDNHGKGQSFSPTDLVAASLGACMATIMGIVAERHQLDLKGMQITVRKHMAQKPVRRIGKLEVEFSIPGNFDEKTRKLLENAAHTCPVHESLHPDVEQQISFHWLG